MTGRLDGRPIPSAGPVPRPRSVPLPAKSYSAGFHPLGAAFTLLEILLALALIALLAGVLVGGSTQLLTNQSVSVDDIFWKAVQEARKSALKSGGEVRLSFVDDKEQGKEFVIDGAGTRRELPVPAVSADTLEVSFLTTQKNGGVMMIAGVVLETQTIPAVIFYADGTCTPFRMQVSRRGAAHIVAIDPWTCAPILTPPDSNALPAP